MIFHNLVLISDVFEFRMNCTLSILEICQLYNESNKTLEGFLSKLLMKLKYQLNASISAPKYASTLIPNSAVTITFGNEVSLRSYTICGNLYDLVQFYLHKDTCVKFYYGSSYRTVKVHKETNGYLYGIDTSDNQFKSFLKNKITGKIEEATCV